MSPPSDCGSGMTTIMGIARPKMPRLLWRFRSGSALSGLGGGGWGWQWAVALGFVDVRHVVGHERCHSGRPRRPRGR